MLSRRSKAEEQDNTGRMDNTHSDVLSAAAVAMSKAKNGGVFIFQNISKSVQLQGYILALVMILFYKDKCNLQKNT